MKINNRTKVGPYVDYCVMPRLEGDIVFKLTAVRDHNVFALLCPTPIPKMAINSKGERVPDDKSVTYKQQLEDYQSKKYNWISVTTLAETEGLEWSKVNYDEPDTWHFWEDELVEFGLTRPEINTLFQKILTVNALDESKMEEARSRFLAGLQVVPES